MTAIYAITIIILLILIMAIIFMMDYDREINIGTYAEIKQYLKTGDILLLGCKLRATTFRNLFYIFRTRIVNSPYGHAGIIYRSNTNNLYLIECCAFNQSGANKATYLNYKNNGAVRIIKLQDILESYRLDYNGIFAVKLISKPIPNKLFISVLNSYKNVSFAKLSNTINLAVTDLVINNKLAIYLAEKYGDPEIFCTEFLYDFLYKCGVVIKYPSNIFWPHLLIKKKFSELTIVNYSDTISFKLE